MFAGLAATRHSGPYWPRYGVPRPRVVQARDKDDTRPKRRYRRTWKMRRHGEPVPEMVDTETGERFGLKTGPTLEEKLGEARARGELEWELSAPKREREERLAGEERSRRRVEKALGARGKEEKRGDVARREDEITRLGTLLGVAELDPESKAWAEARLGALGGKLPEEEGPWRPQSREEQLEARRAGAEEKLREEAALGRQRWELGAPAREYKERLEAEEREREEPTLGPMQRSYETQIGSFAAKLGFKPDEFTDFLDLPPEEQAKLVEAQPQYARIMEWVKKYP